MAIQFSEGIPVRPKVPYTYVEFDNRRATQGALTQRYRVLLVGDGGSAKQGTPVRILKLKDAEVFSPQSELYKMIQAFLGNNTFTELTVFNGNSVLKALKDLSDHSLNLVVGPYPTEGEAQGVAHELLKRNSPKCRMDCHFITAKTGSVTDLTGLLWGSLKSQHITIVGLPEGFHDVREEAHHEQ